MLHQASWNTRVVVVTGGNGFIGRHLTRKLTDLGARVLLLEREAPLSRENPRTDNVLRIPCALANKDALRRLVDDADVVFHLAATSVRGAEEAPYRLNVEGTTNLVEAMREARRNPRLIMASTDRVYAHDGSLPATEESLLGPSGEYAKSKADAEKIVTKEFDRASLRGSVLRLSNVYGPGDRHSTRIVPGLLQALLDGCPLRLRNDGSPKRDFVFISDAVGAFLAVAAQLMCSKGTQPIYNVGSGVSTSTLELAQLARQISGRMDLEILPGVEGDSSSYLDCTSIHRDLGWRAKVSLREGLEITWQSLS